MTSLAFSLYSGTGIHALLLGSGISRSSGIPTGWDIVEDLIRKVAVIEGKSCGENPAAWFVETYGKEPGYTELLEAAAKTSSERMALLRAYFEPNEEERESGKKAPTPAHHAIARLVTDGYIRVIVTTNFDRLMERALEAAGVVPSVIASPDSILGAAPLSQSRCTVIKVHGDYLDTRLKNTPDEVGIYDDAMNRLLDQVLDEYGLIVCGWSADWDDALRAAIERCPNRRYATYWSAFGQVTGAAQRLCDNRGAQIIQGMGADEFFGKLAEKVAALKDLDAQHPLTARMAVATLKRYLADDKDRIRLHDLVLGEADKATSALFSDLGVRQTPTLKEYEARMATLLPLLAAAGYWGRPSQRKLWLRCFHALVTPKSGPFPGLADPMDFYPAYLALYVFGIAALAGSRQSNLAYVLAKGSAKMPDGNEFPLLHRLIGELRGHQLDDAVRRENHSLRAGKLLSSRYLLRTVRETLRDYVPNDHSYEAVFRDFEYRVSVVTSDLYERFWNDGFKAVAGLYMDNIRLQDNAKAEIERLKERWPYLKAGLFNGSLERLMEVKNGHDQAALRQGSEMRFY